jgi:hypothetical protein
MTRSHRGKGVAGDDLAAWIVNQCTLVGECWVWTRTRGPSGYGRMGVGSSTDFVHRVTYELLRGPIPPGLHIDHLCRNKPCCNPWHLEPVTQAENNRRNTRTHCYEGHPLVGSNVTTHRDGTRRCRECRNTHRRERGWA